MRNLASIQKVLSVEPIEGAKAIELAHVLGWQCVIKKGELRAGELAVYFEIDSFLPVWPEFEFLRKTCYKKNDFMGEGFKLRTVCMRGQISQGLLLPVSILPKGVEIQEGMDVTELLHVKKWEMPEDASKRPIIPTFPDFIVKTDEVRIQSHPGLFDEFADHPYYITTKMDGTSCTLGIDAGGNIHACGHNYELARIETCSFWQYAKKFEEPMRAYMHKKGYTCFYIQGEFCGEGIQKNRLKLQKPEWYVFTISADSKRCDIEEMREAQAAIGLTLVPIEEEGEVLSERYPSIQALLARAEGKYSSGNEKEGIVVRPQKIVLSNILYKRPLSVKVINNNYLLKNT